MEPSRAWEDRVVWWTATTAAKAIPNPFRIKAKAYAEQMSSDERLFWAEVRQEFGNVFFDGDQERSNEPDRKRRGL